MTVIILTLDEERHIRRCIDSVRPFAARIVVVDSGSTDRTREVAASAGAEVLAHPFTTHGRQLNWALDHAGISTKWVMKVDADEYATPELALALRGELPGVSDEVGGITFNLRRIFMGKWLRHGGLYPVRLLRLWRNGRGRCEDRWMDEHVVVEGQVRHFDADFADDNLNSIGWWTDKHNRYASREAVEALLASRSPLAVGSSGRQARIKRWVKRNVYSRLPLGLRALAYFVYRYLIRLGFLDGWPGFAFHFLQGCWYRVLVDVKIHEVRKAMREKDLTLEQAARELLGVSLAGPAP